MTKNILTAIGAVGFSLFLHCVGWNDVAGNGTLIGNPVAGVLYDADGSAGENALVRIRKKTFLPDVSRLGLNKRTRDTASVVTDDSGRFLFDKTIALDTGTYVIEATKGNTAVLIDPVAVTPEETTVHLRPDTLRPTGTIKGAIALSGGEDPRKLFVMAYGIDMVANVNADGSFSLPRLAQGGYRLRIVSTLADGAALDTGIFTVRCAETTDVKTLPPPVGNGIPGNGSTITGTLYNTDGSPARGIPTVLREYSGLPDSLFSPIDLGPITKTIIVTYRFTDQSGTFTFDSLPVGTYAVEAASGGATILIDSLMIATAGSAIKAPPDTLKPAGTLTGIIRHSNPGDVQPDFVYLYVVVGNHWYTMAYDNLRFIFNGLAGGSYRVRIISTLTDYPPLNVGAVTIKPGDTTDIGTIELRPGIGIPAR